MEGQKPGAPQKGRPWLLLYVLQLVNRPIAGEGHLAAQHSFGGGQFSFPVVENLQSVVIEDHCSKRGAGVLQLLAELRGPVVARLQKDQVRPSRGARISERSRKSPEKNTFFPSASNRKE